ncbi:MAG: tetratricopeptide repeat protein [Cyclobacteriaceae bacterium]
MLNQKSLWSACLLLLLATAVKAQDGWNWPEDKKTAQEKVVLYTDMKKQGNFEQALPPLQWLFENAPELNNSIYINGADIYEELAIKAKDPAKKKEYVDKALEMYDTRIKYFGNEVDVMNRKANTALKLLYRDRDEYDRLHDIYKKTVEVSGDDLAYYNITGYMNVAKVQYERGKIEAEGVIEIYDKLSEISQNNVKKGGKYASKYAQQQEKIDAIFTSTVTVGCDYIAEKMVPKLEANPDDLDLAKKIIALSIASSCTGEDFFIQAAEATFNKEPNAGLAKTIASRKMSAEDYDAAKEWYEKALELSSDDEQKADIHMDLGSMDQKQGQKSGARNHFLQAASLNQDMAADAYTRVGDMYFGSYEQCKAGEDKVKDRGVFLAAAEMYRKAGNSARLAQAKEQFPSKEDVFTYNYEVGGEINVGCWINESVTIQTRD